MTRGKACLTGVSFRHEDACMQIWWCAQTVLGLNVKDREKIETFLWSVGPQSQNSLSMGPNLHARILMPF